LIQKNQIDRLLARKLSLSQYFSVSLFFESGILDSRAIVAAIASDAPNKRVVVDRGKELIAGGESATALGKIAFQTRQDLARGDRLCTALCFVSGRCETIALCCSTIKIILFRGRISVSAKVISKGSMAFRNACAG
jgi:hypothetical protein